MINTRFTKFREETLRRFPERQVFHRANGEVKYLNLTTRTQLTVLSVGAVVILWCLITLLNLIWGNNPLRSPAKELARAEAEFDRRFDDMRRRHEKAEQALLDQQREFEVYTRQLVEKYDVIQRMNGIEGEDATLTMAMAPSRYNSNTVMMSPRVRDTLPRQARSAVSQKASLRTGLPVDQSLTSVDIGSNDILTSGEDAILDRIETSRAILRATDLSVEDVLSSTMGTGGPEVPLDSDNAAPFGTRLASIQARLSEAESLEKAVSALPFGLPIDADFYKTSSYGVRKDPFTKRNTFHKGMDFGAFYKAPIVASADGVVTKSGRQSGFGNSVFIDHGYGFTTAYGHMAELKVKKGQVIKKGQIIGLMGSTGRSSGVHLHYEVRFNGNQINPEKFIKAGQYVQ